MVDSLCANLAVLAASTAAQLAASIASLESPSSPSPTLPSSSSPSHLAIQAQAVKAYVFLLAWILAQGEDEHKHACLTAETTAMVTTGGAGNARGRGKKKGLVQTGPCGWEWSPHREKILASLAALSVVNLAQLYAPAQPDEPLLRTLLACVTRTLTVPLAMKDASIRAHTYTLTTALVARSTGTTRNGPGSGSGSGLEKTSTSSSSTSSTHVYLEATVSALVDVLAKHEHSPAYLAQLARFVEGKTGGDASLGVHLLSEVAEVDPQEYKRQQANDAQGVKNVAMFMEEMARSMPKAVSAHLTLLLPHLGGGAYVIRSAITTALGLVLVGALSPSSGGSHGSDEADGEDVHNPNNNTRTSEQTAARMVTKMHVLEVLMARTRDTAAFTRVRALATWEHVAVARAVPISHWNTVAGLALERMRDKGMYKTYEPRAS